MRLLDNLQFELGFKQARDFERIGRYYEGDTCPHGVYVGGCGIDWMCGTCEDGWSCGHYNLLLSSIGCGTCRRMGRVWYGSRFWAARMVRTELRSLWRRIPHVNLFRPTSGGLGLILTRPGGGLIFGRSQGRWMYVPVGNFHR